VTRSNASSDPVIMLAGGGTGGHVFPMVAVADAVRRVADVRVVYVGTAGGIEARVVPARGDELELLAVTPIKGRGRRGAVRGVAQAAAVLPSARALVKRLAPRVLLSVGGYAAGPVGLAAWSRRVPVAVLEPNSVLGLANRWLLPFARRAYVAYPETAREVGRRAQRTGVPLRGEFHRSTYRPSPGVLRVLVVGGSQGASALNQLVPRALAHAGTEVPGLVVLHQAGRDRDDDVRKTYAALGQAATVVPFIEDMAGELERADVVIARAGACCLAELCTVGRASILIPFPFAADDHQQKNGDALAGLGAAVCVSQSDATPARVAAELLALASRPDLRVDMAERAALQGKASAAQDVALDLLALASIRPRTPSAGADRPKEGTDV
jgi:UDP-N-acetylglucosamine--N-acetylmuramyl-(pentapeptide) pyrophosphoryl-undecaprenol N-acetylglucosamine transferase